MRKADAADPTASTISTASCGSTDPVERLVAATVHSLGLSARLVSGLNPRVLVFQDISHKRRPVTYEELVVAGFTRGEQLVELAALDPATYEYNFYLFRFEQACNRTRCTPEDLLTEKVESGWTDWTLYAERDLEDTPLDCVSCHLPFGPGTHKQFLMRQVFDPWMHWGDFRGGDERKLCPEQPADGSAGKVVVVADGLDLLRAVEGPAGRYAGVPVAKLHAAKSGELFARFVADAEGLVRGSPYRPNDYPFGQVAFQTREVLCERFHTGDKPDLGSAPARIARSRAPGSLLPTRRRSTPSAAPRLLADRGAFLRRHAGDDAFDVAASFIGAEVATAVGFLPRREDTRARDPARDVRPLSRRRDRSAPAARPVQRRGDRPRSSPVTATVIRQRLSLPRTSPELMPPLRVGELPRWAIARIDRYLRDHCTDPGGCDEATT